MFFAILKILLFCSLLTYCISLNKKCSLEENRSDLQVRGSAKMGFEPKHRHLEARLPFLECQMCSEGNYHRPRRRSRSDGREAKVRNLHVDSWAAPGCRLAFVFLASSTVVTGTCICLCAPWKSIINYHRLNRLRK